MKLSIDGGRRMLYEIFWLFYALGLHFNEHRALGHLFFRSIPAQGQE